ncbi:MAG: apolipoprotein N-acyltransferase [Micropepsaceae bacterium]
MASSILRTLAHVDVMQRIEGAAGWLRALRGRNRLLVAAGLGAFSVSAFAPSYLWPVFFLTFPALVWMIDGIGSVRRPWIAATQIGWAFGFGYFFIGFHWVGFAFVVDAETHGWLLPFVAVAFPGGLAMFMAAAAGVARLRWSRGPWRLFVLASTIMAAEWLRGHVLTGLPWNLPGYAWGGIDAMFQAVSIVGIYGLSLITIVTALLPAALIDGEGKRSGSSWPVLVIGATLSVLFVFGWWRLPSGPSATFDGVGLRIVQPNIAQADKWKPDLLQRNWTRLIDLTRSPGLETRTHVIWTEAAPPFFLLSEPAGLEVVGSILPDTTSLLTGTVRSEEVEGSRRYFNSMAAVSGTGRVLAVYDKSHLVPFGEYLPLFWMLEPLGITKLTGGSGGYTQGAGIRTIQIPNSPSFGPLICYEVIFPGEVVEPGRRPEWLVTMTDDSWFGPWTGPYQHLGIAKIRAAEEGLAVVRAANTGVSAVIDPYGRVTTSLELGVAGIVDSPLPKPLKSTIYAQAGDIIFWLMLIAISGVGCFFSRSASDDS